MTEISPVHRVLVPKKEDRYSFVYFAYPRYDAIVPFSKKQDDLVCASSDKDGICGSGTDKKDDEIVFNTLLENNRNKFGKDYKFGDFIIEKWRGVQAKLYFDN